MSFEPTALADADRRLLEKRAAALARAERQERPTDTLDMAVFRLGRERYAIELPFLLQIFPLRDLALLPGARAPLLGLTPWRGVLLRVLDLGSALGRAQAGIADRSRVLVIGTEERAEFGILIDAVDDIVELPVPEIRTLPGDDDRSGLLRGVTRDAVLVVDAQELLRNFT